MLEVDVHQQLHAFLRDQGEVRWPHHLSVARLVARALRLQRSALIQVSAAARYRGHYRCSYLVPLLLWPDPVVLVTPAAVQQRLLQIDIPKLSEWLGFKKPVCTVQQWPGPHFSGLLILSPQEWLAQRSDWTIGSGLVLLDGVDELESWTRKHLTVSLDLQDWEQLRWCYPHQTQLLRGARAQLTRSIFQHPVNPYGCALLTEGEHQVLEHLHHDLLSCDLSMGPKSWQRFWQQYTRPDQLLWTEIHRQQGSFTLHCAPIDVEPYLRAIWEQQTTVLFGGGVNVQASAHLYEKTLGIEDVTCVQFGADRHTEAIQLYIPDGLPMPNTPEFQARIMIQIRDLLALSRGLGRPTVLVIDDLPLKAQIAALLAAEFGSRVQVETPALGQDSILVTGWDYWLQVQHHVPAPPLLVIATLPIPSLEDPRVAGRVAYYKRRRQDWFRLYLLPQTLRMLQDAIAPAREQQGVVALLDARVIHRSYGQQILDALSPYARINYLDSSLFTQSALPLLDHA
ncbi:helicase C-terminal domain-containing protein [Acaryochloris thomasi]|uniref:helicase C-terminal domain-containing protein n=1 Tax=Acaryochloris thomasi TaxID=2929456 RepID=UPI000DA651DB|nr:helicase C-terminal domain-containing protein [Acaryochloris thomasi]